MKKHAGTTLLEMMVVLLLATIPLAIVAQYMGIIVNLSSSERSALDNQRGLMAVVYDLQRDVKSATWLEVTHDTVSLVSDTAYVKYTLSDGAITRTNNTEDGERLVQNLEEAYFTASQDDGVTFSYVLDGTSYALTLYGEVVS